MSKFVVAVGEVVLTAGIHTDYPHPLAPPPANTRNRSNSWCGSLSGCNIQVQDERQLDVYQNNKNPWCTCNRSWRLCRCVKPKNLEKQSDGDIWCVQSGGWNCVGKNKSKSKSSLGDEDDMGQNNRNQSISFYMSNSDESTLGPLPSDRLHAHHAIATNPDVCHLRTIDLHAHHANATRPSYYEQSNSYDNGFDQKVSKKYQRNSSMQSSESVNFGFRRSSSARSERTSTDFTARTSLQSSMQTKSSFLSNFSAEIFGLTRRSSSRFSSHRRNRSLQSLQSSSVVAGQDKDSDDSNEKDSDDSNEKDNDEYDADAVFDIAAKRLSDYWPEDDDRQEDAEDWSDDSSDDGIAFLEPGSPLKNSRPNENKIQELPPGGSQDFLGEKPNLEFMLQTPLWETGDVPDDMQELARYIVFLFLDPRQDVFDKMINKYGYAKIKEAINLYRKIRVTLQNRKTQSYPVESCTNRIVRQTDSPGLFKLLQTLGFKETNDKTGIVLS